MGFFPFLLVNVSWTLFCSHFCCVDKRSLCMSSGSTLVLSLGRSYMKTCRTMKLGMKFTFIMNLKQ
jgi:hypothetical protein